jgi:hypothetical protein
LRRCRHAKHSPYHRPGAFFHPEKESENVRASRLLTDNADAGNGERRFHGWFMALPVFPVKAQKINAETPECEPIDSPFVGYQDFVKHSGAVFDDPHGI